jgi:hypothetical protein
MMKWREEGAIKIQLVQKVSGVGEGEKQVGYLHVLLDFANHKHDKKKGDRQLNMTQFELKISSPLIPLS